MSREPGVATPAKTGSFSSAASFSARAKAASVAGISPSPCASDSASRRSAASETAAQHELLLTRGCELFQGYLFGRPVPIEDWKAD